MTARRELPETFFGTPFSRKNALVAGLSDERLSASDLHRPFHGVRLPSGHEREIVWRCRAYREWIHPANHFSHQTAAELFGLPLPNYLKKWKLHVSSPWPKHPPEGKLIVGHSVRGIMSRGMEWVFKTELDDELFSLPILNPAVVWRQLAFDLDLYDLVALGDAIVTQIAREQTFASEALSSIEELRDVVKATSGLPGALNAAKAIGLIRIGPLSRPESILRQMIVAAGMPEPQLNVEVNGREGNYLGRPDLSWPEFRVLVEYQGDGHRVSKAKFRSDISRREEFQEGGWRVIQASAPDIFRDPNILSGRLWRALKEAGWHPEGRQIRQIRSARV